MTEHRHQIKPSLKEIATIDAFFTCTQCGIEVEPTRGWRSIRTSLNLLTLIVLLLVVFSDLDASPMGLVRIVVALVLTAAVFFGISLAILRAASLEPARKEIVKIVRDREEELRKGKPAFGEETEQGLAVPGAFLHEEGEAESEADPDRDLAAAVLEDPDALSEGLDARERMYAEDEAGALFDEEDEDFDAYYDDEDDDDE